MNRAQLKALAKQQIKGNIGILFVITLIITLISCAAGYIPLAAVIVTPAFSLSLTTIYINLTKGIRARVEDTFCGFNDFWPAIKVSLLVGLFTFLWSLLFVIPGIVKAYSYSMSMYVLAENKNKPALECIEESKAMTNGFKAELFVLDLSFFGWHLLGSITFGIAYIWVIPYISATYANGYNFLKPVQIINEPQPEIPLQLEEGNETTPETAGETNEENKEETPEE